MKYLDETLPTLEENLALDEALLLQAERGGPEVLRLWEWRDAAVVLGAGGCLADDVDETNCAADGVPIRRRSSGGGTVLLGSGCLLYTVVLAYRRDPRLAELLPSYGCILQRVIECLRPFAALSVAGSSDLTTGGRKVSGNAQQRKRDHLLHHGTLLYNFNFEPMARYLKPPPRQPAYRQGREHRAFLVNLPARVDELKQALRAVWQVEGEMNELPHDEVHQLVVEKFAQQEWIYRR